MNEPARAARHREALRVRLEKVREEEVHRIHREHAPLLHVRRLDRDDRLREDRVEEPPRHVGERELRDLVHEVPRPCLHPGRDRGRQLPLHLRGVDEHETHVHGQLCQLGLRLGELRAHPDGDGLRRRLLRLLQDDRAELARPLVPLLLRIACAKRGGESKLQSFCQAGEGRGGRVTQMSGAE